MSIYDISDFMTLGGQTVPEDVDETLTTEELLKFWERIDDELEETWDAIGYFNDYWQFYKVEENLPPRDIPEVVDGFLDIAYVAMTGAIRVAGAEKARLCWEAICDANLAKVDGRYGPVVRDEETGKILKPEGWIAPDIEGILNG